jgi:hypothetical protein
VRITVDIEEEVLNDLVAMTGESKKSPAISRVVTDWVKRQKAKAFGKRIMEGHYDYPSTNEEIEGLDR